MSPTAPRCHPQAPECLKGWDGQDVAKAESLCGLYAPPLLSSGEAFNDDLEILELAP